MPTCVGMTKRLVPEPVKDRSLCLWGSMKVMLAGTNTEDQVAFIGCGEGDAFVSEKTKEGRGWKKLKFAQVPASDGKGKKN